MNAQERERWRFEAALAYSKIWHSPESEAVAFADALLADLERSAPKQEVVPINPTYVASPVDDGLMFFDLNGIRWAFKDGKYTNIDEIICAPTKPDPLRDAAIALAEYCATSEWRWQDIDRLVTAYRTAKSAARGVS